MCNRARLDAEPDTLCERFGAKWVTAIPNQTPIELYPKALAPVIINKGGARSFENRHFAMVTCDANELVAPVHPKAMVTILAPADQQRWLTGSQDDIVHLQRPYPAAHMAVRGPIFPTREKAG